MTPIRALDLLARRRARGYFTRAEYDECRADPFIVDRVAMLVDSLIVVANLPFRPSDWKGLTPAEWLIVETHYADAVLRGLIASDPTDAAESRKEQ